MMNKQFYLFNSLPNDKFLDCSKLKAFADNKIYKKFKFGLGRVGNIAEKGEKCWLPQCFQKASYTRSLKVGIVW